MAVIAAVEFDSDTLIGGAVVIAELDLETGLGRCVEALTTELDLDMGCGGCVGVGVVEDERMVAAEFAREREGGEDEQGEGEQGGGASLHRLAGPTGHDRAP